MSNGPHIFSASDAALPGARVRQDPPAARARSKAWPFAPARTDPAAPRRIGIISNPRSHRNRNHDVKALPVGTPLLFNAPGSQAELAQTLARFAAARVDMLIIDGGDGTVRDVLTATPHFFGADAPRIGLVPSGKTNALAHDLGIPHRWSVQNAVEAVNANTFKTRAPLDIRWADGVHDPVRGFLFGTGAFVRATNVAQRTHRLGAFNGAAVGLSLALGVAQTLFGPADNPWRMGEPTIIRSKDGRAVQRSFYLVLGSTLERLPLGLKPFGQPRGGLKLLAIDAPPRQMIRKVPALLAGSESETLDKMGYHRGDPASFELSLDDGFILDGEHFPGGDLIVTTGAPLHFAVP